MPEITFTNSSGLPCEITAGEESCFLLHGESKKLFSKSSSFPFEAAVKKSNKFRSYRHLLDGEYIEAVVFEGG